MKNTVLRVSIMITAAIIVSTGLAVARDLTFEERVAAQEAIERVYYSHQIGATRPFEEAVPREVLESKVRQYLEQTVALEDYWKTRVTDEMLNRELERMVRGTRLPERLRELFAALNEDPFLVKECLARATLVDRLTRNFYAFDPTLHVEERRHAEEIERQLAEGELDPRSDHPDRTVLELIERDPKAVAPGRRECQDSLLERERPGRRLLSPDEFRRDRAQWPETPGRVGPVVDEPEAFVIQVVLSDAPGLSRAANYVVPKRTWDLWWESVKGELSSEWATAVARDGGSLSVPASNAGGMTGTASPSIGAPDAPGADDLSETAEDGWNNGILDDLPEPRTFHTAVWTGTVMVVWGGASSDPLNTGGRYDPATDTWTTTSTAGAPSARRDHTAVWTGSEMIVWGGTDLHGILNTGGRYDPITDAWTATSTVGAPSARWKHTAVWTGTSMVIWGGASSMYFSSGGQYDPATDTWTATSTTGAPSARWKHTAVWTGTLMVVWGGYNGSALNTGGRYDPSTNTWTPTSNVEAPSARQLHTAIWSGTEMLVWGGYDGNYLSTGGRYDPAFDTWKATSNAGAPSARLSHTMIWTGSVMVVWGGSSSTYLSSGGRYDPATDAWSATSIVGQPAARDIHTAVWTGTLMVVWGGSRSDGSAINTGGRYDPATDSWTPTSTLGTPSARYMHTAVWTGSEMIVWGGTGNYPHAVGSGGRYDPARDSWTPTSTLGAPSERYLHTAVWTGLAMVVWGGHDGGSNLDTGGRYNPVTDSWTTTSTAGAPSARGAHTAVWTGNEMVVWGGRTAVTTTFYFLNTGGRYDPSTDSWRSTSTLGAPLARVNHSAIWTGSRMVVWGGDYYVYNTGGQYDPSTDKWTPTATLGTPPFRGQHTAVWTGTVMLVWGGFGGSTSYPSYLDTGGQYNPATDSWAAISTLGAPTSRYRHTAVWTGTLMVVWGGYNDSALNTGGRYDPSTNTWTPTSNVGAPSARQLHTAVWTGTSMVVWGGFNGPSLNTGGRYVLIRNHPPAANAGPDQTIECTAGDQGVALLDGSSSNDPDSTVDTNDDIVNFEWSEGMRHLATGERTNAAFSLGDHVVTLAVKDKAGASSTDDTLVRVRDTTPPALFCPASVTAECQSAGRAEVVVLPAVASDSCHGTVSVANDRTSGGADASGMYPLGTTRVTFSATDGAGNTSTCETEVTVVDTTPPLISATLSPALLWPPNHRMVDVGASVVATDVCSTPAVLLTSATNSELDDAPGGGDGNTTGDIQGAQVGTPGFDFQLRAERDGGGSGRAYRITYTAVDGSGNQASASSIVFVPHDQGGSVEPVSISADADATGTVLSWETVPGSLTYQAIRGNVGSLSDAGAFIDLGTVSCVRPASGATSTQGNEDAENPSLGEAFFYLVAYNDGRDSGYGSDTATKPRVKTGGGCE
jgi:N-acetylneuraminic acid mutarotase